MPEVDPRFDPQYQRGFDPTKHKVRAPHPAPAAPAAPAVPGRDPIESAPAPEPAHRDTDPAQDSKAPDEHPDPPRGNPFRLALLLTSIGAIIGAGLLLWKRIAGDPYQGYGGYGGDVAKIFFDQFSDALMTPLLTGGLLGLALWLALGALRRRSDG